MDLTPSRHHHQSPTHRPAKDQDFVQCDMCDKQFTRAYNMESHRRTHFALRPFTCAICGRAFTRMHDQRRHESLHYNNKTYHCGGQLPSGKRWGCGKAFARAETLGRHLRAKKGQACLAGASSLSEQDRPACLKLKGSRPRTRRCDGSKQHHCDEGVIVAASRNCGENEGSVEFFHAREKGQIPSIMISTPGSETQSLKQGDGCVLEGGLGDLSHFLADPWLQCETQGDMSPISSSNYTELSSENSYCSGTIGSLQGYQPLDVDTNGMHWCEGAHDSPQPWATMDPAPPLFLTDGSHDVTGQEIDKQVRLGDWLDMSLPLWPEWDTELCTSVPLDF